MLKLTKNMTLYHNAARMFRNFHLCHLLLDAVVSQSLKKFTNL